jgi:hypothetical protein
MMRRPALAHPRPRWNAMTRPRLAAVALLLAGCAGISTKKDLEQWSPTIPGSRFKTIATLAANNTTLSIRLMVQVREQVNKAGRNAVRQSGRWDGIAAAVAQICGSPTEGTVDGVLVVNYDQLVLYDCETRKKAFEIQSSPERGGGLGVINMTKRLIKYLEEKPAS